MQEEFLSLLRQYIGFQTVKDQIDQKTECLDWIQTSFLSGASHPIRRGEAAGAPYLLLAHPNPKLLLFGHIDVVPGTEQQFVLRQEGDLLYGRGVKDMKGAGLTLLVAYRDAIANGEDPPVSLLFTSDEENGGRSIPIIIEESLKHIPVAYTPDNGAHPQIVTQLKGAAWTELRAQGKGSHGAYPWTGKNPVFLLSHAIAALEEAFPAGNIDEWHITVSPTQIHASDADNTVPDIATCMLDVRFTPDKYASVDEVMRALEEVLPAGTSLTPKIVADPLFTDRDHPMVRLLQSIASEVLGKKVELGREHGASDARFFGKQGIPAFLYGPTGGDLHGANEWVSLSSLLQHVEINRRLMQSL